MKVVSLSALRTGHLYPPGNIPGTHFCQRLSQFQGHTTAGRIMSMQNSDDIIGNRTRGLPACREVPQPTAPPCAPCVWVTNCYSFCCSFFVYPANIDFHEGYLTVHLPHEIKWNTNLMQQGNFIDIFLARHVSGTYIGRVYGVDGAVHHTHDLCSGSQDHHPSKTSVQKTICCNSTSNATDDGRMYPKHVEIRTH